MTVGVILLSRVNQRAILNRKQRPPSPVHYSEKGYDDDQWVTEMLSSLCSGHFGRRLILRSRNLSRTDTAHFTGGTPRLTPYRLAIFDKDGTLTCFNSMWAPWSEHNVTKLAKHSGKDLADDLYYYFNYNKDTKKFGKSCVAHDTHKVVRDGILRIMTENHDIPKTDAVRLFNECWEDIFDVSGQNISDKVQPLGDVKNVFEKLKQRSVKTAICSSDQRDSVELAIDILGIGHLVDEIVCGNDPHNTPKPAPDNVHWICNELGVDPQDTVMIGDTYYDTKMGKSSNCGLIIGILSGQSDETDLKDAHHVTSNLDDVLPLILNTG